MRVAKSLLLLMLCTGMATAAGVADITGEWTLLMGMPNSTRERTIKIDRAEGKLTGTMIGAQPDRVLELEDLRFANGELTFFVQPREGNPTKLALTAKLVEGQLRGTVMLPNGDMPFTGYRPGTVPEAAAVTAPSPAADAAR